MRLAPKPYARKAMDLSAAQLAQHIADAGGHALLVGGAVRDPLLGMPASKDCDLEVFGLEADALEACLRELGPVDIVGRAFGVYKLHGTDFDISLPRRDNRIGKGHRDFAVDVDPQMSFADAARRRDFTINAIGYDPLRETYHDPFNGRADCRARLLRMVDAAHFAEDPLRGLRGCQFIARFALQVEPATAAAIHALSLSDLSRERMLDELRKLLLRGVAIADGVRFLHSSGLGAQVPGLAQRSTDAWQACGERLQYLHEHAAALQHRAHEGLWFAALLADAEISAETWPRNAGDLPATEAKRAILVGLDLPKRSQQAAAALLALLGACRQPPRDADLRHAAWLLAAQHSSLAELCALAESCGITRAACDRERAHALGILTHPEAPLIQGRDLLAAGLSPGPAIGHAVMAARQHQYEGPCRDRDLLLRHALDAVREP